MTIKLDGSIGVIFPDNSSQSNAAYTAWRNRIANGDTRIDQRNNGAAVTLDTGGKFPADRWLTNLGSVATVTMTGQRSAVNPPTGFTHSLLFTTTTGAAPAATHLNYVGQVIEGVNVADLLWGTANAQPVVVSFLAKASVAGQYGLAITNGSSAVVPTRSYVAPFTINSANTWEYKMVVVPGDTTGTWATDNTGGVFLRFDLGSGSNYNAGTSGVWTAGSFGRTSACVTLAGVTGATLAFTGVQLEPLLSTLGSATPFERVEYSEMLRRCQRYYWQTDTTANMDEFVGGYHAAGGTIYGEIRNPVPMRIAPSVTVANVTYSNAQSLTASVSSPTRLRFYIGVVGTGYAYSTFRCLTSAEL